jgi:hypothetical protein
MKFVSNKRTSNYKQYNLCNVQGMRNHNQFFKLNIFFVKQIIPLTAKLYIEELALRRSKHLLNKLYSFLYYVIYMNLSSVPRILWNMCVKPLLQLLTPA